MFAHGGRRWHTTVQALSTFPMPACSRISCCLCCAPAVSRTRVRSPHAGGSRDPFAIPTCPHSSPGQSRQLGCRELFWRSDVCWCCSRMKSRHRRQPELTNLPESYNQAKVDSRIPQPHFPASLQDTHHPPQKKQAHPRSLLQLKAFYLLRFGINPGCNDLARLESQ